MAVSTPSIVQHTSNTGVTTTDISFTLGSTPTVGNLLVVAVSFYTGVDPILAPAGWKIALFNEDDTTAGAVVFERRVATGDGTSWTLTVTTGADTLAGAMYEITGQASTQYIRQIVNSHDSTGTATTLDTNTLVPHALNCLALAFVSTDSGSGGGADTATVGAGWTIDERPYPSVHPLWAAHRNTLTSDTSSQISATFSSLQASVSVAIILLIEPEVYNNPIKSLLLENGSHMLLEDGVSLIGMDEPVSLDGPSTATTVSVTPNLSFVGQALNGTAPLLRLEAETGTTPVPFTDRFNDNIHQDTRYHTFGDTGTSIAFVNKEVEFTIANVAGYATIQSWDLYDIRNKRVYSRLVDRGDPAAQADVLPVLIGDDSGQEALMWIISGNNMTARTTIGGTGTDLTNLVNGGTNMPYYANIHKWFGVRETQGTIWWEWSTDGWTWVPYARISSTTFTFGPRNFLFMQTGIWGTPSNLTTKMDNWNVDSSRMIYEVQIDTVNTFDSQ